jgi:Glycosyltransferase family 87
MCKQCLEIALKRAAEACKPQRAVRRETCLVTICLARVVNPARMIALLSNGKWLTPERIRAVSLISLMTTLVMMGGLFATSHGTVDALHRPLGTDFSNVWTAGRMALDHKAAAAWDWPAHFAVQQELHKNPDIPFYGWHYPPPFLLVAMLLAKIPYVPALIIWQVTTLGLALRVLSAIIADRRALLVALGCPIVLVCFGHGQNGFLTAALLCGGLLLLDRRPMMAGILMGCMIYKPQFGLILPVFLLFGGQWRAIGGAVASASLLCGITLLLWGTPVWSAFLHSLPLTQSVVIEQGATGWEKIQSVFSAVRNWGGSVALAWSLQTAITLLAIGGAAIMARSTNASTRNAFIVSAALLATPYCLDYDLVPLSLSLAFLVVDGRTRGFLPFEKTLYALIWVTPLFARAFMLKTTIPMGLIALLLVFILSIRRSIRFGDLADFTSSPFRRSRALFAR